MKGEFGLAISRGKYAFSDKNVNKHVFGIVILLGIAFKKNAKMHVLKLEVQPAILKTLVLTKYETHFFKCVLP